MGKSTAAGPGCRLSQPDAASPGSGKADHDAARWIRRACAACQRGQFVIARLDDVAVGCGALKITDGGYGELKRMWVSPSARGLGIGQRLLRALEEQAASAGVEVLRLDTHGSLIEARELYARNGYTETPPYNANPYAHHWFEKRISSRRSSK
jgi:GNAT superfamily N-acetyltransferase